MEYDRHAVLAVGARAQTLARLFNLREGFTADDDKLPKRVRQAFETGPLAGVAVSEENFAWAKRRYYELMNWDGATGVPTARCLQELQLDGLLAEARPRPASRSPPRPHTLDGLLAEARLSPE